MAGTLQSQAKRVGQERLEARIVLTPLGLSEEFKPEVGKRLYSNRVELGEMDIDGREEVVRAVHIGAVETIGQDVKDGPLYLKKYNIIYFKDRIALELESVVPVGREDDYYLETLMKYAKLIGIHAGAGK